MSIGNPALKEEISCINCGKIFQAYIAQRRKFCSCRCSGLHNHPQVKILKSLPEKEFLYSKIETGVNSKPHFGHYISEKIRQLLKETEFVKLRYNGNATMVNKQRTKYVSVDFFDKDGIPWRVNQVNDTEVKFKLGEITRIINRRVSRGTEIHAE